MWVDHKPSLRKLRNILKEKMLTIQISITHESSVREDKANLGVRAKWESIVWICRLSDRVPFE